MKSIKKKLIVVIVIISTLFSVDSVPILASPAITKTYDSVGAIEFEPSTGITPPVDPEDPEVPIVPEGPDNPGTAGPLSIDFASGFKFGRYQISASDQIYYAAPQKIFDDAAKTTPAGGRLVTNYVQVTDNRGTEAGWGLTVTQNDEFTSTSDPTHDLAGSEIRLVNINTVTAADSPPPSQIATSITLDGAASSAQVMAAADGEGAGTHLAKFGTDAQKTESVMLYVPGRITKYTEVYNTSLTWTLTDVPANTP